MQQAVFRFIRPLPAGWAGRAYRYRPDCILMTGGYMFRRLALFACVALLSACGADGPPEPPSRSAQKDGLRVSGEARIGIVTSPY